jgi:serine/threonine protein kinase
MVTGQVPFEGATPFSVAMKHKAEAPLPPKKFNPQLPDDISRLILRCLEKASEQRYKTAEEFLADLSRIEEGLPTPERITPRRKPTSSREITVKLTPRKLVMPSIGLFVLIVIAILLWRFISNKQPAPPVSGKPSLAILYFDNLSDDKSLDAWKTGLSELLITKLSQSKFIDVLDGNSIYSYYVLL